MSTRAWIAVLLTMPIGAVLFGVGTTIVLSAGGLNARAPTLLPAIVGTSLLIAPLIAWQIAPLLRVRVQRSLSTKKRLMEKHGDKLAARR
ncbi:MAG: hypothetical protein R3D44_11375 [Hyphomicrobiaceae bacterium]